MDLKVNNKTNKPLSPNELNNIVHKILVSVINVLEGPVINEWFGITRSMSDGLKQYFKYLN